MTLGYACKCGICPKRRTKGNGLVGTQETESSASSVDLNYKECLKFTHQNKDCHEGTFFDTFLLPFYGHILLSYNEETLKTRLKNASWKILVPYSAARV